MIYVFFYATTACILKIRHHEQTPPLRLPLFTSISIYSICEISIYPVKQKSAETCGPVRLIIFHPDTKRLDYKILLKQLPQ